MNIQIAIRLAVAYKEATMRKEAETLRRKQVKTAGIAAALIQCIVAANERRKQEKTAAGIGQRLLRGSGRVGAATALGGIALPSLVDFIQWARGKSAPLK